jgi:hypothetical protein
LLTEPHVHEGVALIGGVLMIGRRSDLTRLFRASRSVT